MGKGIKEEKDTRIILTLSDREMNGKRQVLARCLIWKRLEARIKTDVWVIPDIFHDGEIYATKKQTAEYGSKAVHDAQSRVSLFVGAMSNVISETRAAAQSHIFQGDTSKEWKEWIQRIMFLDRDNLYQHWGKVADWTYRQMRDAVEEQERRQLAAEKARREEQERAEQQRTRHDLIYYVMDYPKQKNLSTSRTRAFRVLARYLLTWQYYKRIVKRERFFTLDYASLKTSDINEFIMFLKEERKPPIEDREGEKKYDDLRSDYSRQFEQIDQLVNEQIPPAGKSKIVGRSDNYMSDILDKLNSVYRFIVEVHKIPVENPVTDATKYEQKFGTPFYLTKEERNIVQSYDLSNESKGIQECRDIFIFQCHTGMRYGDLSKLTRDKIVDGWLNYTPNKTIKKLKKDPEVPLNKVALDLVEKYKNIASGSRVFPMYSTSQYDRLLKDVLKVCGINRTVQWLNPITQKEEPKELWEVAASHIARRTFIGTLYKEVKDPDLIGRMSGHVEGSKSFARYRAIDRDDLKDTIQHLD